MDEELKNFVDAWGAVAAMADDLDPAIREALRPVYDRLKRDAPHTAPAMALAMICRALRMLSTIEDGAPDGALEAVCNIALAIVKKNPTHPE